MGFLTDAIHIAQEPDESTGAIMPPIYLASTYAYENADKSREYVYSRTANPTRCALEKNIAALEKAKHAFAFSTGMAATIVIGQPDFTTVTPGLTNSKLTFPSNMAFDSAGNLFVVDSNNARVLMFLAPLSTGMAASVVIGQPDFTSGNSAPTPQANSFTHPKDVALDASGNLLISDATSHRIMIFSPPFSN